MHQLRPDSVDNLPAQSVHLLNELRSQLIQRNVCQILQLVLLGQWSDHSGTVTLFEKRFKQSTNSIFLVDRLTESFLILKCFL